MEKSDFLVIGGGIAGLTFALEVAKFGSVTVLCKKGPTDSSTAWAQGGIAAVSGADDSFELHIDDTLRAGAGLCNRSTVELVVREGPQRVNKLIELGANFDRGVGLFHLNREGGHSRRRVYHAADTTGSEIQRTLLEAIAKEPNVRLFDHANAINLITQNKLLGEASTSRDRVLGAYVLIQDERVETFVADKILLATGGAGKVYLYTSNPDVASGDGIAMAHRAGARVSNMEFYQFHPTCLYHPRAKSFLITEAMRGEGAKLRRINGEPFMHKYHDSCELAPRDVVARAIDYEMKLHGEEYVLLDITHKSPDFIRSHFPMISETCLRYGIDITTQPIPVVPAAHYLCGGIVVNEWGETDLENLYAAGECSHTGLHGANRLASNSLLEGLVYGARAAKHAREHFSRGASLPSIPPWDSGTATDSDEQVVITQNWDEIRRFMWNYVGIVRTNKRLARALSRWKIIDAEINDYYWNFKITSDLLELRNLSQVASMIIRSALMRKESRGLHYNLDYPNTLESEAHDTVLEPC